jgi:hypothetical protein
MLSAALLLLLFFNIPVYAQYSATIGSGTNSTTSTGSDPINGYYEAMRYQVVYTATELYAAGMVAGAVIDSLGWSVSGDYGGGALQNYTISLAHTTAANSATHNTAALTQVVNPFSYNPTVVTAGNFDMIRFNTTFIWDGVSNILVDVCTGNTNPYVSPYGQVRVIAASTTNGSRTVQCDGCTSRCNENTTDINNNKPQVRFSFGPAAPCAGTPVGGTPVLGMIPACGGDFSVGITGSSLAFSNFSYQWQDSVAGGSWNNIGIDTIYYRAATASLSGPTYIRRNITCTNSSQTASSGILLVNPVSGGTTNSTVPVCGDSITLSTSNSSAGAGLTYQWEESADSTNWSVIPGQTGLTAKIPTPLSTMFYRREIACGFFTYSVPVKVLPVRGGTAVITSALCNDSTLLSLTGASTGLSIGYQWLISSDSINWTPATGTSATYKFASLPVATYFRSVLTCGTYSDSSVAVKVNDPCQGFRYSIARNTGVPFSSIQATGNTFTWAGTSGDDDRTAAVLFPAGFNFTYNGVVQPAFFVCTNGWMSFDTLNYSTAHANDLTTTSPKYILAPFWDDLVTLGNSSANRSYIKYEFSGTAPNRVLTVEWAEMERYQYGSPNLNFQVKLHEGSNDIEYIYGRMQPFDGAGTGDYTYSIGMTGSNPGGGQRIALYLENTRNFRSTPSFDNNTIVPACNSSYYFTAGGSFNPSSTSPIPANDSLSTPVVLAVNPVPCTDACGTYYSSRGATPSATAISPVSGTPDDDVWFQFTAPASGQVNISIISSPGYNPAFQVMTASFDTAGLGAAASVNVNTSATESVVAGALIPGNDYMVRVFNAGAGAGSTSGAFSICINEIIPPPSNDDTTGAIVLTASPVCTPYAGTTLGSTASSVPVCGGDADDDVWFRFTPNNAVDTITVDGSGTFRAHVQIFNASMVSLFCQSAASNGGTLKLVATNLKHDSLYWVRVYHSNAGTASAAFDICITGDNATTPIVTNAPVEGLTDMTARVSGNIVYHGGYPVTASGIVFGLTSMPTLGDPAVVDSATAPVKTSGTISFDLSGLTPSTTYYYRTYATNILGTTYGGDSSFTTTAGPVAPTLAAIRADQVTETTARIGGRILFSGGSPVITSGVLFSTSPASIVVGDPSVTDSATTPLAATGSYTFNLAGLNFNTIYYFRSYATNGAGTGYSEIDSFLTLPVFSSFPYVQDFESLGTNSGWKTQALTGANDWQLGTPAKGVISAAYSGTKAWVTKTTGAYSSNHDAAVVSPVFDCSALINDPVLRFKHKFVTESCCDGGWLEISINGGAWIQVEDVNGTGGNYDLPIARSWYNTAAYGATWGNTSTAFSSNDAGWITSSIALPGTAGQANVRFRFRFESDPSLEGDGWALDDVELLNIETPTIQASAVTIGALSDTSANISWTSGNGEGRIVIAHLTTDAGADPADQRAYTARSLFRSPQADSTGTGNFVVYNGTGSSAIITGLTMYTDYTFTVYEYNGTFMHTLYAVPGASNTATTLPVSLTSFTAAAQQNNVILNWTTASETNNKGFAIERSTDGKSFETVGFVKGAGNSNSAISYSNVDAGAFKAAASDILYYRLKQTDFDGTYAYSKIARVSRYAEKAAALAAYPNPFDNSCTVSFDVAKAAEASVKMFDVHGKLVAEQSAQAVKGSNEVHFTELQNLHTGIYFIKVTVDGETRVLKLVKH